MLATYLLFEVLAKDGVINLDGSRGGDFSAGHLELRL